MSYGKILPESRLYGKPSVQRQLTLNPNMRKIPLTQGKVALVDDTDCTWLSRRKWCAVLKHRKWYAMCKLDGKTVYMHRLIFKTKRGQQTDHHDGNGLNNQRYNLRKATHTQNGSNRGKTYSNTSGFKGVYSDPSGGNHLHPWKAQIKVNGSKHFIGRYCSKVEAARPELTIKLHSNILENSRS